MKSHHVVFAVNEKTLQYGLELQKIGIEDLKELKSFECGSFILRRRVAVNCNSLTALAHSDAFRIYLVRIAVPLA